MIIFRGVFVPPKTWVLAGAVTIVSWCGAIGFAAPSFATDFGIKNYRVGPDVVESDNYDIEPRYHPRIADRDRYQHYGDVYGNPRRDDGADQHAYDGHRAHPPYRGSLKDGYDDDVVEERRWNNRSFARRGHGCVPKRRIRRMLRREGWRGFRNGRVRGPVGYVEARRRGTGEIYELAVDRCTGEVISAAIIDVPNRRWRRRGVDFRDYRDDVVMRWSD